jgi:hypothetical protein
METKPTSFRLSTECREIIRRWADKLGVKDADVVEMWARVFDQNGMEVPPEYVTARRPRGRPPKDR